MSLLAVMGTILFALVNSSAAEQVPDPEASTPTAQATLRRGQKIVAENCVSCHGITKIDRSTHPEAPPFREIASRYSVWLLAESLAEGIVSGHPDMPEFVFEPDEINAILTYMDSLKENKQ